MHSILDTQQRSKLQGRGKERPCAMAETATRLTAVRHRYARVYQVRVLSRFLGAPEHATPASYITLLTPREHDRSRDQLFLDMHPIAPEFMTWDPHTRVLSWAQGIGNAQRAGRIEFLPDGVTGYGFLSEGTAHYSVEIGLQPVSYTCAVSANAGAYVSGDASGPKLNWDVNAPAWKNATWINGALRFTYGLTDGPLVVGQKTYSVVVQFNDLQTTVEWDPASDTDFSVVLTPAFRFIFSAAAGVVPPRNDRGAVAGGVDAVFPYQLAFDFDGFAANFTGAYLTRENSALGKAYAIQGTVNNPAVAGLYALTDHTTGRHTGMVSVHQGQLVINGEPVPTSRQCGNRVLWQDLAPALAQQAGLPVTGTLHFSEDGEQILTGEHGGVGVRLNAPQAQRLSTTLLARQPRVQQAVAHAHQATLHAVSAEPPLRLQDLVGMVPFAAQTVTGADGKPKDVYTEAVRDSAMQDFYQLLQFYMDPDLRQEFVTPNAPVLDPTLKNIAAVTGADGTLPRDWYPTLGVAYLTSALARLDDEGAPYLNAQRAQKWLSQQVAQNAVYKAQAPQLYANRWNMRFPSSALFLQDQIDQSAQYAPLITADRDQWIQQIQDTITGTPEQIQTLVQTVTEAATKGANHLYWAYTFFRYSSQPSALNFLRNISLGGNTGLDGSAFAQRVQTNLAVLNILDSSGYFAEQYLQVIRLFQIGNILPVLIDYSGNLDEYEYAVTTIIQKFIATYGTSTDPKIAAMVQQLNEALQQQQIREILDAFAGLAATFEGIYNWEQLAARFEQTWPKVSKISLGLAKAVTLAAVSVGMMAFVYGVLDWKSLDGDQRAAVVLGGVQIFVLLLSTVLRRGTAYVTIFRTENTWGEAFKIIFKQDALAVAEQRTQNGLARWLVRDAAAEGRLLATGAEEDMTLTMKIFGRNLDEFVASRLGAIFALANIVLSAIALAHSNGSEEKAGNGLLLASATLELFALVGEWGLGAFGIEAIGGLAVASIASGVLFLAGFAAIAGIILLLVIAFRPQKSPITKFAEGPAQTAGFYMQDKASLDALNVSGSGSDTTPHLVAVSLEVDGDLQKCLTFQEDNTLTIRPQTLDFANCFFLVSDALGRAVFTTLLTRRGTTALGTPRQEAVNITLGDAKTLQAAPPLADATKLLQQSWASEYAGNPRWENGVLVGADFRFYNAYWADPKQGGQKYYLNSDGTTVSVVAGQGNAWTVTLSTMYPSQLSMPDITLWDYQRDQQFLPYLGQPGSAPRSWNITPSLPDFMGFDAASGKVYQQKGVAPREMEKTAYTLSVANTYGKDCTSFALQVSRYVPPPID